MVAEAALIRNRCASFRTQSYFLSERMTLLRLAVTGLLLAPLCSLPATAQFLDPGFTPPSGVYAPAAINALGPQQPDGKRLVSGLFSRVNGAATGQLVRLDAAVLSLTSHLM